MSNLPELSELSIREIVIMLVMQANPYSIIEKFYLDEDSVCFCKFKGEDYVQEFTKEMQMVEAVVIDAG